MIVRKRPFTFQIVDKEVNQMKQMISLIFVAIVLLIIIYLINKSLKYKTERERDATKKSLIAYLLTNSFLVSWFVYKKNNPNDRL